MKTPDRTTAAAFPRYAAGEVLADSASLQWPGLYVRRYRFPRVVDRFLVPATPEPLISCGLAGSAEFRERELGETWVTRQIGRGDIFVTRSKTPYEVRHSSRVGEELEIIQVHVAVDHWLESLEAVYPGKGDEVDVIDFFGRDEALACLCFACAEMLSSGTLGKSKRGCVEPMMPARTVTVGTAPPTTLFIVCAMASEVTPSCRAFSCNTSSFTTREGSIQLKPTSSSSGWVPIFAASC